MHDITELYCLMDDFCKKFDPILNVQLLWLEQFNLILRCSRLPYYLYCLRSQALNQIKLLEPYALIRLIAQFTT